MAYQRYQGYQYETSPRKIQPEYESKSKKKKNKKASTAKKINKAEKVKVELDSKAKLILYLAVTFAVLFGISYRNSLITEQFDKKEKLKTTLSSMQKENEQAKVNIESNLNLKSVEEMAKEKLGMKKLDNSQKIYINLPKKDYIEVPTQEVVVEEDSNFWQKLWKGLTQRFTN